MSRDTCCHVTLFKLKKWPCERIFPLWKWLIFPTSAPNGKTCWNLETSRNLLKPLETSWNLLKPLETWHFPKSVYFKKKLSVVHWLESQTLMWLTTVRIPTTAKILAQVILRSCHVNARSSLQNRQFPLSLPHGLISYLKIDKCFIFKKETASSQLLHRIWNRIWNRIWDFFPKANKQGI